MWELTAAVALASLVGSVHCAGMCGPFVALLAAPGEPRLRADTSYHAGRLVSYAALGALAGGLGAALDLSGAFFGLQRVALTVAGGGLVVFGLLALARSLGWRVGGDRPAGPLAAAARRLQARALRVRPGRRGLAIGLASGLLPCGWLYAFVFTAAATGQAAGGALAMVAFWLGTVPALGIVGFSARRLLGPLQRRAPAVGALALVAVGLVALSGRFAVPALSVDGADLDGRSALDAVAEAAETTPPCCAPGEDGDG